MFSDPLSHFTSAAVILLAVGTALVGIVDSNSAMVVVSVIAAVGATLVRIYSQVRSTRRENDVADAKAYREVKELEKLREEIDRLREQLVKHGCNPWDREKPLDGQL